MLLLRLLRWFRLLDYTLIVGVSHTMISLICMSTHKAITAGCLSCHQATSGQPAIRALATAPLRRLTLSVLFTITTTSYQTTCTVSERSSIKGTHQCKPTPCRVLTLRHGGNSDTALKEESHGCFTVPIAGRKGQ